MNYSCDSCPFTAVLKTCSFNCFSVLVYSKIVYYNKIRIRSPTKPKTEDTVKKSINFYKFSLYLEKAK